MKKVFLYSLSIIIILSTSTSGLIHKKKINFSPKRPNLNSILNTLFEGEYYNCSYKGKSYSSGYKDIKSGFFSNRQANSTINLIINDDYIGIIYEKNNRWYKKHSIYEHSSGDLYYLGPFYHYKDYKSWKPDKWWKLNFNNKDLIINPHKTYFSDYYNCQKLKLSQNEKIYTISKFAK